MSDIVKYPEIHVKLVGEDGNAFNVLGVVLRAMRDGGVSKRDRDEFTNEAMDGDDYNHLLATCMKWITVE